MSASHAFEEHVSEVLVHLEATTPDELFAEAGRAFAELVCGELPPADGASQTVVLKGRDREALLVALFDELVFRAEVEAHVFPEITAKLRSENELEITLRASSVPPRSHVKAATLHGLAIVDTGASVS